MSSFAPARVPDSPVCPVFVCSFLYGSSTPLPIPPFGRLTVPSGPLPVVLPDPAGEVFPYVFFHTLLARSVLLVVHVSGAPPLHETH